MKKCTEFLNMPEKELKPFGEEQGVKKIKFHSRDRAQDVVTPDGQEQFGRWGNHMFKVTCEVVAHFSMLDGVLSAVNPKATTRPDPSLSETVLRTCLPR